MKILKRPTSVISQWKLCAKRARKSSEDTQAAGYALAWKSLDSQKLWLEEEKTLAQKSFLMAVTSLVIVASSLIMVATSLLMVASSLVMVASSLVMVVTSLVMGETFLVMVATTMSSPHFVRDQRRWQNGKTEKVWRVHNDYPAAHNGYPWPTGVGARDTCMFKK